MGTISDRMNRNESLENVGVNETANGEDVWKQGNWTVESKEET